MPIFFNPMDGTLRVKPAKPKRFDAVTGEFYMGWLPPGAGASAPPEIPAQADLNFYFKVDGDSFLPNFMLDRSPNGIADPTSPASGQRGRMLYGDVSARAVLSNEINGKSALQIGGQTRLNASTSRDSSTYAPYYSPSSPFTTFTAFKGVTLDAVNSFYIMPEITGTPSPSGNFATYAFFFSGNSYLLFASDSTGIPTLSANITATTFNSYSTVVLSYNGLGFSASNLVLRINGSIVPISVFGLAIGSGNGGVFLGTNNLAATPCAYLLESAMWNRELTSSELTQLNDYTQNEYTLTSA